MWKVSKKKNQTEILEIKSSLNQIKNTVKSHFSAPEQVEERISGLKDKIDIKEKTEEFIDKRLKSCKRKAEELFNSLKRPNLQMMCKPKLHIIYSTKY
jgi:chromosome segregation ATPase